MQFIFVATASVWECPIYFKVIKKCHICSKENTNFTGWTENTHFATLKSTMSSNNRTICNNLFPTFFSLLKFVNIFKMSYKFLLCIQDIWNLLQNIQKYTKLNNLLLRLLIYTRIRIYVTQSFNLSPDSLYPIWNVWLSKFSTAIIID